jgi:hypothetical protein
MVSSHALAEVEALVACEPCPTLPRIDCAFCPAANQTAVCILHYALVGVERTDDVPAMTNATSHTYTITMQTTCEVECNKRMIGILDRQFDRKYSRDESNPR